MHVKLSWKYDKHILLQNQQKPNLQTEEDLSSDQLQFDRKILHTAWHPKDNIIALAATNNLYIFSDV